MLFDGCVDSALF